MICVHETRPYYSTDGGNIVPTEEDKRKFRLTLCQKCGYYYPNVQDISDMS